MSDRTRRVAAMAPSPRQVGAVLGTLLVIAVVVPFAVFAVPQVIGADHGFVTLSGSMEPDIAPGDVVIVDASASVGVGDVITFSEDSDVPVTHRIVGEQDGQWVTKGDANEDADARPVSPENVLGRVVLTIPLIGHVILWANTPVGYVVLVLVPLVLLLANELLSWARARDGEKEAGGNDDSDPVAAAESEKKSGNRTDGDERSDEDTMTQTRDSESEVRSTAPATATGPAGPASVTLAVADLKLSLLASLALVAYAAWNVYVEVTTVGAPNPISVGALTAGLLGLLFTGWVTAHAWYTTRNARAAAAAADDAGRSDWPMPETDGGVASGASRTTADGGADDDTDPEAER
jgi:signal peptidase